MRRTKLLDNAALIAEKYIGIRPAPGYPACPDHTAKGGLFKLLDAEANAGMRLTESFAMTPAASVAGLYIWPTPRRTYFAISKIDRDQLEDWAQRGPTIPLPEASKWLAPSVMTPSRSTPCRKTRLTQLSG